MRPIRHLWTRLRLPAGPGGAGRAPAGRRLRDQPAEGQYNIAPTQKALIVGHGDDGYQAKFYRWGLVPSWAKDIKFGAKTINARAEAVSTKPSFRNAFKKRRCLVPASGYFEWRVEEGGKQPYFIHDPAGDLLMFAGLWEG